MHDTTTVSRPRRSSRTYNPRYAKAVQEWAMRWHQGNPAWVHERFGFNPDDYGVDLIDRKTAVDFITRHHYSRSVPALRRYRFGLFRLTSRDLLRHVLAVPCSVRSTADAARVDAAGGGEALEGRRLLGTGSHGRGVLAAPLGDRRRAARSTSTTRTGPPRRCSCPAEMASGSARG